MSPYAEKLLARLEERQRLAAKEAKREAGQTRLRRRAELAAQITDDDVFDVLFAPYRAHEIVTYCRRCKHHHQRHIPCR